MPTATAFLGDESGKQSAWWWYTLYQLEDWGQDLRSAAISQSGQKPRPGTMNSTLEAILLAQPASSAPSTHPAPQL